MRKSIFLATLAFTFVSATVFAASLDGRLGITGKGGVLVPLKENFISSTSESKPGIAVGGGLIFGISKNLAVEVDVTHVPSLDVEISGSRAFEASLTDVSLGMQFRLASDNRMVPYFGIGADFIKGDIKSTLGSNYNLDWTEGGHVNIGLDYFLTRLIALTADLRGIGAFKGDVKSAGVKVGEYNPISFVGTLGIRLILPDTAFRNESF
jgi:outer membrane protein